MSGAGAGIGVYATCVALRCIVVLSCVLYIAGYLLHMCDYLVGISS